ncbi:hypothetical protein JP75_07630 [Devosia riboflavina]|uniref:Uncharacterized protein n=1 Tax=Devosia riboflavina TaxID=46914 RepID=A0A087M3G8_9HYPH|nr:hypothetical protein [Devosia riboflavina]KFL31421.1 hypothetical protein JP75_07630 [Devosia riboflavina]
MMRAHWLVCLVIFATPAVASDAGLSCQALVDEFEDLRSTRSTVPALFDKPFHFDELRHATVGEAVLEDRMEQPQIAIKNHTGYLDCRPDGSFALLDICANLVPESDDKYLVSRFEQVIATLLNAVENKLNIPDVEAEPLFAQAAADLQNALVRGDNIPHGTSDDLVLAQGWFARAYTTPEWGGITPPQFCFQLEFFEE